MPKIIGSDLLLLFNKIRLIMVQTNSSPKKYSFFEKKIFFLPKNIEKKLTGFLTVNPSVLPLFVYHLKMKFDILNRNNYLFKYHFVYLILPLFMYLGDILKV